MKFIFNNEGEEFYKTGENNMHMYVEKEGVSDQSYQQAREKTSFVQASAPVPVSSYSLRPDLAVCFWEQPFLDSSITYSISFDIPVFRFSLLLETSGSSLADSQEDFERKDGQIEMRFFPDIKGNIILAKGQEHKWVDIILKPSFLGIALPDDVNYLPFAVRSVMTSNAQSIPCDSRVMTPEMYVAAKQLANCPYKSAARTLFLKSKTLELLAHILAEHSPVSCRTKLSTYEIDCLNEARRLLINDLTNPPSLRELARSVGLGESKLKAGFKELFGQTVFGFFRTYRVDLARKMLLETTASVSEVAGEIGYTNISHFSAAFKERHGVTPSSYRKNSQMLPPQSKS